MEKRNPIKLPLILAITIFTLTQLSANKLTFVLNSLSITETPSDVVTFPHIIIVLTGFILLQILNLLVFKYYKLKDGLKIDNEFLAAFILFITAGALSYLVCHEGEREGTLSGILFILTILSFANVAAYFLAYLDDNKHYTLVKRVKESNQINTYSINFSYVDGILYASIINTPSIDSKTAYDDYCNYFPSDQVSALLGIPKCYEKYLHEKLANNGLSGKFHMFPTYITFETTKKNFIKVLEFFELTLQSEET